MTGHPSVVDRADGFLDLSDKQMEMHAIFVWSVGSVNHVSKFIHSFLSDGLVACLSFVVSHTSYIGLSHYETIITPTEKEKSRRVLSSPSVGNYFISGPQRSPICTPSATVITTKAFCAS